MKNYTAALCCGVLAVACQYLQQDEPPPQKEAPWSTAYGGNGPLPGSMPQCSNEFECRPGQACIGRKCIDIGNSGGGTGIDAGAVVDCVDPGPPKNGVLGAYSIPEGVEKVGCGNELGSYELKTLVHVATGFGQYYGVVDSETFAGSAACGACIEVSRDGVEPLLATVVDQCLAPDCAPGDIALSPAALTDLNVGDGEQPPVSWRYVECPTTEVLSFRLEDPAATEPAVQVQGHLFALTALEANVAGVWQPAMRREDNYWVLPPGALSNSAYLVRVTDVNGSVQEASLLLVPEEQYSGVQFPSCR